MPTSYTSLLGLALPVTGELSGTWGDTVNDYITQYLDASVAGTQTISGSQTAVTLSKTTASSLSQAGSGATGSSQYMIINCTGNPASLLTITAPAASKPYIVINATSTSQQVKLVGSGPTTGVTLESGERAVVAWNGSDFVKIATSTADGVTTFSAGTTGFTPSSATSGAVTLAGTLATTNGGTGLTSFTANGLLYASSSSALTTGSALTFDGNTVRNNQSSGTNSYFRTTSGTVEAYFGAATASLSTGVVVGSFSNNDVVFYQNASEGMRLTSTGLGIGASPSAKLDVSGSNAGSVLASRILNTSTSASSDAQNFIYVNGGTAGDPYTTWTVGGVTSWSAGIRNSDSDNWYLSPGGNLATSPLLTVTVSGFTRPVAYADTVSALGNTGTATTINLQNANVFTATLTGNCTFTLSNPIATGSSSFTLILTNDGTAGRTVAWSGGSFVFPGGAASLSRTTTANAVDVWVFFTPNGGTTWYGNIAMKNMTA